MEARRSSTPAPDAGQPPDDHDGPPPGGRPTGDLPPGGLPPGDLPAGGLPDVPPPDAERRPIGALLIVGFLTLTIMVTWYGMFALNIVRN